MPSATTLLGIVKHCTFVEKVWFHVSLAGRSRAEVGIPEAAEDSWVLDAVRHRRVGARRLPRRRGRRPTSWRRRTTSTTWPCTTGAGPLTLRWIYVHMVEELARHAGHGDILREQVLAAG